MHPWRVSIRQAYEIQKRLRKKITLRKENFTISRIAAVDVGFKGNLAKAAICVFDFPDLRLIETQTATAKLGFPYVPGLLTFREGPVILKAFKKVRNTPDVILFDGQGICHPRKMGIAAHLGIILGVSSVGCAKSFLYGSYEPPTKRKGSYSYIYDKTTREVLGMALCTRSGVKPVFVSCGYKIDLRRSQELVSGLCIKYRIPGPLRLAHRLSQL